MPKLYYAFLHWFMLTFKLKPDYYDGYTEEDDLRDNPYGKGDVRSTLQSQLHLSPHQRS